MTNNYVKTERQFHFFDDRDMRQMVEVNRVTRNVPRSIYRPVRTGPLADAHEIGTLLEE